MDKGTNSFRSLLLAGAVLLGLYLAVRGYAVIRRDQYAGGMAVLAAAYGQFGEAAAQICVPAVFYREEEAPDGWVQAVLRAVSEQIPFLDWKAKEDGQAFPETGEASQGALEENERLRQEAARRENQESASADSSGETAGASGEEAAAASVSWPAETASSGSAEEAPDASVGEVPDASAGESSDASEEEPSGENPSEESPSGDTVQTAAGATAKVEEIPAERLTDYSYLLNQFFVVDPNTTALESQINAGELLGRDMTLAADAPGPQILIYHTHSQEGFADTVPGDVSGTVIGLGDELARILEEEYGYEVLHITDAFDMMDGQLDRSKAYNYAEPVIAQALEEHPSVQIVIDLHRDGVDESKHLVTEINGKQTAQVMFFNGLSRTVRNGDISYLPNPYIEDNLAFSFQLEYLAKQYYPGYTRCIYLKGYRYNLHLRPRSLLLEVGAQTNTVEEARNALAPFADLLHRVLMGEK